MQNRLSYDNGNSDDNRANQLADYHLARELRFAHVNARQACRADRWADETGAHPQPPQVIAVG